MEAHNKKKNIQSLKILRIRGKRYKKGATYVGYLSWKKRFGTALFPNIDQNTFEKLLKETRKRNGNINKEQ
jgi:hypothetical protein